jgi:hypothetical protein
MENQKVQFVTVGDTLTLSCGRIAAMTSAGLRVTEEPVPSDFFKENRLKDLWGIPATTDQWAEWAVCMILMDNDVAEK